ncbi:MAG: hypothetical protein ACE5GB_09695 [Acidimicrobiales bacterium]
MQTRELSHITLTVIIALLIGISGGAAIASVLKNDTAEAATVTPPVTTVGSAANPPVAEEQPAPAVQQPVQEPAVQEPAVQEPAVQEPVTAVDPARPSLADVGEWAAEFSRAHAEGDVARLLSTLHPMMRDVYGSTECDDYVAATLGSIGDMTVSAVGPAESYAMPGPDGGIELDPTYPVTAEWTVTATGERVALVFHLVPVLEYTGQVSGYSWLTTCGQPVQEATA